MGWTVVRFEGVLCRREPARTAAWMAAQAQELGARVSGLGAVALSLPFRFGVRDGDTARRLLWSALRGMSEDRLAELGEEAAEELLGTDLRPVGLDLVERRRAAGDRLALLCEHPEVFVQPLVDRLRVDRLVANRLEIVRGRCTGRLVDPVVGGLDGAWLRAFCDELGTRPEAVSAFGARGDDAILLSAAGSATVVHPDRDLRRVARSCGWPIVEDGS